METTIICLCCGKACEVKSRKSLYCSKACKSRYLRSGKNFISPRLKEVIEVLRTNNSYCDIVHRLVTQPSIVISLEEKISGVRFLEIGSREWIDIIHGLTQKYPKKQITNELEQITKEPITPKNYISKFQSLEFPEEYKNLWNEISADQNLSAKDKAQWKIKLNIK